MKINLEKKSKQLRKRLFEISLENGGHVSTSFSCMDILVSLYYSNIMKFNIKDHSWENRDRFILSKGHAETGLYIVLSDLGFFPIDWMRTRYRKGDFFLGGHPDNKIPGVEATTGALGHGLGIAAGISLGAKLNNKDHLQYVLLGDAECTEGSIWEAALFSSKYKLNNLVAIIDRNQIGALDFTNNFTSLDSLSEKWTAFGWEVVEVDGHNHSELVNVFNYILNRKSDKPIVVIAKTIKGKGIKFMENDPAWHTKKVSTSDEIQIALNELNYE